MNANASATAALQFEAIKERQQKMWASGDFSAVAAHIHPDAERLAEAANLVAGSRVLDVATGSGNAAIAAARRDCDVIGLDYVPSLLEHARARARAEGLAVEFVEGDAEELPFPDASFDAVLSIYGVMFAPDQERAAGELLRVCVPGGTIALACWTPDGFVGDMLRVVTKYVPPPAGVRPPVQWGTEERLRELFGSDISELRTREQAHVFKHRSAEEFADFYLTHYGPTERAAASLDDEARASLRADLVALGQEASVLPAGGPVAIPGAYLEAVAVRA
jgi:ubiquinone/menaquinone biosynthesis C-methylase UbiE